MLQLKRYIYISTDNCDSGRSHETGVDIQTERSNGQNEHAITVAVLIYLQWTKAQNRAKMSKWKLKLNEKGNPATVVENRKKYRRATATLVAVMELL